MKRLAVIGGGLGGLAVAARLAVRGFEVSLYEQQASLGGKASRLTGSGYTFDTGPSLLTMPQVIEELFRETVQRASPLELRTLNPICRYYFANGVRVDGSSSHSSFAEGVRLISEHDAKAIPPFLEYSRRIFDITHNLFLRSSIHELSTYLTMDAVRAMVRLPGIDAFRTVDAANRSFFSSPEMIQLFNRYTTYNGSDPFRAPATLNVIPHVEYALGGFYPAEGMYSVVEAIASLAVECGVKLHLGQTVQQIIRTNGVVSGLRVNGEIVPAEIVVSNVDVEMTRRRLCNLPPRSYEASCSGLVFLWGMRGTRAELAHHNILFSGRYSEEFREIFRERRFPSDPTVYISISSKSDPSHAPVGGENWFVLVNTPSCRENGKLPFSIAEARAAVMRKIRSHSLNISENDIEFEEVITPLDLETRTGALFGSIYGRASNSMFGAFARPANRSREVRGLYYVGGTTHPGGGVPLVLLSARIVEGLICGARLTPHPPSNSP